jgi:YVTN family beta-propeller protein
VANDSGGTVSVISTATNTVIATPATGSCPADPAVTPDGSKVFVSNFCSGTVSVISPSTDTVVATITAAGVFFNPYGIAFPHASQQQTPAQMVSNLITLLSSPGLGLTSGQISSLTTKLNNVLASIQAGSNKQAINQLNAFISSVQSSFKTGKMSLATANTLIGAANAIIAVL